MPYVSGSVLETNQYYVIRYVAISEAATGPTSVQATETPWTGPSYILTWGNYINFGSNCLTGDFNGDGLTDVACPDGAGNWNMGLSTGTGFGVQKWPTSDGVYHKDCTTGDFNGDGKTDIACYVDGAANPIQIYLSTGSGFQTMQNWAFSGTSVTGQSFTGQGWSGAGLPPPSDPDGTFVINGQNVRDTSIFSTVCSLADLNGDGKTDILCYSNNPTYPSDWVYALSTGSGFTVGHFEFIDPPTTLVGLSNLVVGNGEPFHFACILGDFMGSGLNDILCNNSSYSPTPPPAPLNFGVSATPAPFNVGIIGRQ